MRRDRFFAALLALLLTAAFICPALGQNAILYDAHTYHTTRQGEAAAGVLAAEGSCPLVVEKEVLTFDAQSFPQLYYQNENDFLTYDGRVTAEYSLYNPTRETVTAKLRVPLGTLPEYGAFWNERTDTYYRPHVLDRCSVTLNDQPVETCLRHTIANPADIYIHPEAYDLDPETDAEKLSDTPISDRFFTPDLLVTKYTYSISAVYKELPDNEKMRSLKAACILPLQPEKSRYLFPYFHYPYIDRGGAVTVTLDGVGVNGVYDEQQVVYVLGEPAEAAWEIRDSTERPVEIAVTLLDTEEMTFYDLALTCWDEAAGVSATDWYNAMTALYSDLPEQYGVLNWNGLPDLDITPALMGWYEYELTLGPGERAVHTVTTPIYPTVDQDNRVNQGSRTIYGYNFLLSPARTWSGFGTLEVRINTPAYLIVSNLPGFEKTDAGYICSPKTVPDGEVEFVLCEEDYTPPTDLPEGLYLPAGKEKRGRIRLILAAGLVLPPAGVWIWRRCRKRR